MNRRILADILDRTIQGIPPNLEDISYLISLQDPESIQQVMSAACKVREKHSGNKIFLYGFIYLSTYCRNHCTFCFYRKTNQKSPRYRKSVDEAVAIACGLADAGVHLVDFTLGEDPMIHDTGDYDILFEIIQKIKKKKDIPIMISAGVVPDEILWILASLETDWYALYQETHNPVLYKKLRIGQSFERRSAKRDVARLAGMLVEDGILLGVGETLADRAHSIITMKSEDINQARVMSFIPQPQTPLAHIPTPPRMIECLSIATMRLAMPDRLIPASLDVDGIKGLKMRLEAGANVVTSIIPPSNMLAGVSQSSLDIEQGLRSVSEVEKVLSDLSLQVADAEDYLLWMDTQKSLTAKVQHCDHESEYPNKTVQESVSHSADLAAAFAKAH
jgi:methylornithine synthase